MNESNTKPEKPQKERRYDPELLKKGLRCDLDQYEMLNRCAGQKDMTEWNEERKKHPNKEILLEGARFQRLFMDDVRLDEDTPNRPGKVCLKDAVFIGSHLNKARFMKADLRGCNFRHTELNEANLILADVRDADFSYAQLQRAKFPFVIVNEKTRFFKGSIDRDTWFWGVALHSMRIADEMRLLLEYNVRRMNWEDWYTKQHWLLAWPIRKFWQISDYGISTQGIIKTFFKWAFVFAIVYYAWGCIDYYLLCNKDYPGIVSNLFVLEDSKQAVSGWLVPLRAIYFSIVTMTTLGLGDMYANAHSLFRGIFGHILLAVQVILGYVLMGALVTCFAVLFTAGGLAGKFADEKEKEDKK